MKHVCQNKIIFIKNSLSYSFQNIMFKNFYFHYFIYPDYVITIFGKQNYAQV